MLRSEAARITPAASPDTAPAATIVCHGLTRTFGKRRAIDSLDLTIEPGCLYGIVGPNGAGKTTFFRLVAGLLRPTSGEIGVLGARAGAPATRAALGYMTQSTALYTDLTVRENVRFFARIFGLSGEALERAVDATIELVDLGDREGSLVRELSGGMKRRVSLACAVVHRPQLLLLDEPTAGVDPELRATFWDAFEEWASAGTTLVVATHHVEEARRCHRLGLFREGSLIAEGEPEELLARTGAESLEAAFVAFARRQA